MKKESTKKICSPKTAAINFIRKAFDVKSRAPRSEFWWIIGIFLLIEIILHFTFKPMMGIFSWLVTIPYITLQIRRLHDINLSGWVLVGLYAAFFAYSYLIMAAMTLDPMTGEILAVNLTKFYTGLGLGFGAGITFLVLMLLPSKNPNKYNETGIKLW